MCEAYGIEQKIRKAIKTHVCNYCGDIIEKGERYEYEKYIIDGKLYVWKSHLSCERKENVAVDCGDSDLKRKILMNQMTLSFRVWCLRFHPEIYSPLRFGHVEMLTNELADEYIAWCRTEEGKKYLEGGEEYEKRRNAECVNN